MVFTLSCALIFFFSRPPVFSFPGGGGDGDPVRVPPPLGIFSTPGKIGKYLLSLSLSLVASPALLGCLFVCGEPGARQRVSVPHTIVSSSGTSGCTHVWSFPGDRFSRRGHFQPACAFRFRTTATELHRAENSRSKSLSARLLLNTRRVLGFLPTAAPAHLRARLVVAWGGGLKINKNIYI